jgi:hypothetical protein
MIDRTITNSAITRTLAEKLIFRKTGHGCGCKTLRDLAEFQEAARRAEAAITQQSLESLG